eukprot:m51a1_g10019 hypothetical protein (231) ;mRNA; f:72000-72919
MPRKKKAPEAPAPPVGRCALVRLLCAAAWLLLLLPLRLLRSLVAAPLPVAPATERSSSAVAAGGDDDAVRALEARVLRLERELGRAQAAVQALQSYRASHEGRHEQLARVFRAGEAPRPLITLDAITSIKLRKTVAAAGAAGPARKQASPKPFAAVTLKRTRTTPGGTPLPAKDRRSLGHPISPLRSACTPTRPSRSPVGPKAPAALAAAAPATPTRAAGRAANENAASN